ncbi:hypothetical protein Dsin_014354 [Dipteronia sinensis]|uniref:DUF4220 domain-containing protein n=1 Tax=Dipteronia sinensis TaxID=43782 RepID=A0AAE0AMW2_9ROSI|nr:hypothetical protein Dsin_014354 [Dipteronia sinensis]
MSQCSLLRFTSNKAKPQMSFKLLNERIEMGKYWQCEVSEDLRRLIFIYVWQKSVDAEESRGTNQWKPPFTELPSTRRIAQQLSKSNYIINIGGSINEGFEFEYSIIVWHIATEIWYYSDRNYELFQQIRKDGKMIKRVSRYMMYLLVERPSMLSLEDSTYRISFKEMWKITDKEPREKSNYPSFKEQACERLRQKYPIHFPSMSREELLIYLAMELVRKVNHKYQTFESKWGRIGSVWMDLLGYAARNCKGNEHAQQLRRGGELLTHVWLLLCHFGLTDHYRSKRDEEIETERYEEIEIEGDEEE